MSAERQITTVGGDPAPRPLNVLLRERIAIDDAGLGNMWPVFYDTELFARVIEEMAAPLAGLVDKSSRPETCPHQMSPETEARIVELGEREELQALRPDLDGNQIMELLGIGPGRVVGQALDFLMELRLDEGPLGEEEAANRLRTWWAERQ